MILNSILKSYHERAEQGLIEDPYPYIDEEMVDNLLKSSVKEKIEAGLRKEAEENADATTEMGKEEYKGHLKRKMVSTFVK